MKKHLVIKGNVRFITEYVIEAQREKLSAIYTFDASGVLTEQYFIKDGIIVEDYNCLEKVISESKLEDGTSKVVIKVNMPEFDVTIYRNLNSSGEVTQEVTHQLSYFLNAHNEQDCDFFDCTTTFEYEYDELGNWIVKRKIEHQRNGSNVDVLEVTKRMIAYSLDIQNLTTDDDLPF